MRGHLNSRHQSVPFSVCLLTMGSECVWAFEEGSNFQLEGLKIEF